MSTPTKAPPRRPPEERTASAVEMVMWQMDEVTELLTAQQARPTGLPVGGVIEVECADG